MKTSLTRAFTQARVKAGAALLDIMRPGWAERVDLDTLDLAGCQLCVLGQLEGDYFEGVARLFGAAAASGGPSKFDMASQCGFDMEADFFTRNGFGNAGDYQTTERLRSTYWSRLTDDWRNEIKRRRAKTVRA